MYYFNKYLKLNYDDLYLYFCILTQFCYEQLIIVFN